MTDNQSHTSYGTTGERVLYVSRISDIHGLTRAGEGKVYLHLENLRAGDADRKASGEDVVGATRVFEVTDTNEMTRRPYAEGDILHELPPDATHENEHPKLPMAILEGDFAYVLDFGSVHEGRGAPDNRMYVTLMYLSPERAREKARMASQIASIDVHLATMKTYLERGDMRHEKEYDALRATRDSIVAGYERIRSPHVVLEVPSTAFVRDTPTRFLPEDARPICAWDPSLERSYDWDGQLEGGPPYGNFRVEDLPAILSEIFS